MRIIPAIDIMDGKCVRLTQGDYGSRKIYNERPLEVAKAFEASGLQYLHVVDLDGARSRGIVNHSTLEMLATNTGLQIDFGGGVKTGDDIRIAFECGATQVNVGSVAIQQPELFLQWLERYGEERIILGADCRDGNIAVSGWTESSTVRVLDYIRSYQDKGVRYVVCTDIACDGTLEGPGIELYQDIMSHTDVNLIASGGVGKMEDLYKIIETGCTGAIIGKAIYEGRITLAQLSTLC